MYISKQNSQDEVHILVEEEVGNKKILSAEWGWRGEGRIGRKSEEASWVGEEDIEGKREEVHGMRGQTGDWEREAGHVE